MNSFDKNILLFLNSFIGRWPHFDVSILEFQHNFLLKGAVFVALIWYFWFVRDDSGAPLMHQRRAKLVSMLCAMLIGLLVARIMANLLPFRPRPLANLDLHLQLPVYRASGLSEWSAFPSDHAVVWFALAAGIYSVSRRAGIAALLYTIFLGLGRIYVGYHHPTDIIAGGAIGILLVTWLRLPSIRSRIYAPIANIEARYTALFYAFAFMATYELANLFNELRGLVLLAWHALRIFFPHLAGEA